ncbi:MAG: creatininase [Armatimonadetes bacterium]|nr:creatininase [Armatimonadota bacterium]
MTDLMWDMTWVEFQQRARGGAVAILPWGATEQHGPHLPLSTDTVQVAEIARMVAARTNAVVAPAVPYGYTSQPSSGGGPFFAGTLNLGADAMIAVARDLLSELVRHGIRRIVVLSGHGENMPFLIEGAEQAVRAAGGDARVVVVGWWQVIREETLRALFPGGFPGWDREHAAFVETSMMWALSPAHVRRDALRPPEPVETPAYTVMPPRPDSVPRSGALADPGRASPEAGQRLVDEVVEGLLHVIEREFPPGR